MAIKFKGDVIPGSYEPIIPDPPHLQRVRTKFWGADGESEIVGQRAGRMVRVKIFLHNDYNTYDKLRAQLRRLEDLVGSHGTLEDTGRLPRKFLHCTFEGFTPQVLEGQQGAGSLQDVAGTLTERGSWFCYGELRWYQLSYDAESISGGIS